MAAAAFAAGAEVVLAGLQSSPELNGARGALLRYDAAAERWHVRLAHGQIKNVREVNLRAAAAPAAAPVVARQAPAPAPAGGETVGEWLRRLHAAGGGELPNAQAPSAAASAARKRVSPPFTAIVEGGVRVPLALLTSLDGFGRLGAFLLFSAHEGAGPLRPWYERFVGDAEGVSDEEVLCIALNAETPYGILTDPVHEDRDRASMSDFEVMGKMTRGYEAPNGVFDAMVAAGVAKRTGRRFRGGGYVDQPVFRLLYDEKSWKELEESDGADDEEEDDEEDDDGEAEDEEGG